MNKGNMQVDYLILKWGLGFAFTFTVLFMGAKILTLLVIWSKAYVLSGEWFDELVKALVEAIKSAW